MCGTIATTRRHPLSFLRAWTFASAIVICLSVTQADEAQEGKRRHITYDPVEVARVDLQLRMPGDPASQEPNEDPPPKVHPPAKIYGEILVMGKPIAGVTIKVENGDTVVTDPRGQYIVEVPFRWSGKITPIRKGWIFDPPHRVYECVREDIDERHLPDNPFLSPEPEEFAEAADPPEAHASTGLGRLGVSPMVLAIEAQPGETLTRKLTVQNMGVWSPTVRVAVAQLQQQHGGQWFPVQPNLSDPESLRHTCGAWLNMSHVQSEFALPSMGAVTLPISVSVPDTARGLYSAAIVIQPEGMPKPKSTIGYNIVVPLLVRVNEKQARSDVRLEDVELIVPFTRNEADQPRIRLTVTNRGETLCRTGASVQVATGQPGTDLQGAVDIPFPETWIMPGATVQLLADYQGPHPDQPLSVHGTLRRIEEQPFNRGLMGAQDIDLSLDPAQTLAMLDYGDGHVIHVEQDRNAPNPYRSYVGQCSIGMLANFPLAVRATVHPCSPAQGLWRVKTSPTEIHQPTDVQLAINAQNFDTEKLPGGARNTTVAQITVHLIPKIANWHAR